LVISLSVIYLITLAPGLTWATGYPFYLLLERLFQCLPTGSLAFRTNLLSALATALAAALVYALVTRGLSGHGKVRYWPAGMAAGNNPDRFALNNCILRSAASLSRL
jgi:hypothetical protein